MSALEKRRQRAREAGWGLIAAVGGQMPAGDVLEAATEVATQVTERQLAEAVREVWSSDFMPPTNRVRAVLALLGFEVLE